MPPRSYRAERRRDLADECRAIAALCTPSTEMQTHYSPMAERCSKLAKPEELGRPTLRASPFSTIPASWMAFRAMRVRCLFRTVICAPLFKRFALC
jgi:hypothetical protein